MVEVIVLGAGVAGLAAAAELAAHDVDVIVVEARPRIGGRIFTVRDARTPVPIELGAEFVHGESAATRRLLGAARQPIVDIEGRHFTKNGAELRPIAGFDALLERTMNAVRKRLRGADRTFAEALRGARLTSQARALATSFVEGFNAADAERISAKSVATAGGAGKIARTLLGYDGVPAALAARLPEGALRLCTIATHVTWRRSHVEVAVRSAAGGDLAPLRAKRLVVTLPLPILAAAGEKDTVTFTPPLEDKRTVFVRMAMGNVLRISMRFRDPFWTRHERLSFVHAPGAPIGTWWTSHPVESSVLTGWAGGPAADALLALGEARIVDAAVSSLAHVFARPRAFVAERVDAWFFHDWSTDPYARGAYSYPLVNGSAAARRLAAPVDGTLFFAGEATAASPDNGTVHGAFASGTRAAAEILQL